MNLTDSRKLAVTNVSAGGSKLLGLEVIRFLCALTILVFHANHFTAIGDNVITLTELPLYGLLWPIYEFGKFGVQIFWCISGFIFYWKYADALAARRVEPKRFFWLRFSRLYPLHLLTLLLVAALQPLYAALAGKPFMFETSATSFLLQLGLADQWAEARAMTFNGPIWSVSAEVFVYVGFFLLLRTFGKSPWVIIGAIMAALASMWSEAISPALICGGYFFAGGAAAQLLASERVREAPRTAHALALIMVAACLAAAPFLDLGSPDDDVLATWLMVIAPPILFLAAQDWRGLARWQGPIQAAGNLTYSTYLIHFPMQLVVAIVVLAGGIALPVGETWFLLAYLAAVIAIGRVVFLRFEAPVQNLIRAATLSPSGKRAAA